MTITAKLWDKQSPINGNDAAFISEHFKKDNGNDDRVLIFYDGNLSRIQLVDDSQFSSDEKLRVQSLIDTGTEFAQAIAAVWERKAQAEYDDGIRTETLKKLKDELAATDYKITKAMEYQLVGLDAPYDLTELHALRQTLRDQINELEA